MQFNINRFAGIVYKTQIDFRSWKRQPNVIVAYMVFGRKDCVRHWFVVEYNGMYLVHYDIPLLIFVSCFCFILWSFVHKSQVQHTSEDKTRNRKGRYLPTISSLSGFEDIPCPASL